MMGVLLPLYLAGLTALSLPLIFHLVRRTPRGRQDFSSLIFLAPSIPRLTRRSRLDQILLLLLRLLALACVAIAFSRPFLREASLLSSADLTGRRVALLLDNSASMRRGDLWTQAVGKANQVLDELNPQDDVALFTFGERLTTVVEFAKEGSAPVADKTQVVRNRIEKLQLTWDATDLGTALVSVAGELDAETDISQSTLDPQIVVISDFQKGSRIEALRSFEWPKRVPVVAHKLTLKETTNASAQLLPPEEGEESTDLRARVTNAADSTRDQFFLSWNQNSSAKASRETAVYVPAGQSRVLKLPRASDELTADRMTLRGDDQEFDNQFYVVPPVKQDATVLYVGNDKPDAPDGPHYFLKLAVANDPLRQVTVESEGPEVMSRVLAASTPGLIVITRPLTEQEVKPLQIYVERGGTLFLMPDEVSAVSQLSSFLDDVRPLDLPQTPAVSNQYLLLGDIQFTHPLFAGFAAPRYNDFTKIHFWKHHAISLRTPATSHVVARFDNGHPALVERLTGQGRVITFLSGWQPRDSQFALSSKFVPFIGGLLDLACGGIQVTASANVNESVTLPKPKDGRVTLVVMKPDGSESKMLGVTAVFTGTDVPGIYSARTEPVATRFAVNIAASESDTAHLDLEQLEQSGVRMGIDMSRTERIERIRQQRDTELETRQKIWRWLIVVAIGTLILESLLAGRTERDVRLVAKGSTDASGPVKE